MNAQREAFAASWAWWTNARKGGGFLRLRKIVDPQSGGLLTEVIDERGRIMETAVPFISAGAL